MNEEAVTKTFRWVVEYLPCTTFALKIQDFPDNTTLKIIWMVLIVVTSSLYIAQNWFCLTGSAEGNEETNRRNVDNMQILGSETASSYINHRQPVKGHWIVVLVPAHSPICDVTHFSGLHGWKIVVVGGNKQPLGCRREDCTFLTPELENELGFSVSRATTHGYGRRKMVGYLYAISKRAEFILDTECDIIPKFNKINFIFSEHNAGLVFTGRGMFNPYRHFGYSVLFPRGFPPNVLNTTTTNSKYHIVRFPPPLIQQAHVNFILQKHDVESLRLSGAQNISFDRSSPPVFLSRDSFAPINALNTLYFHKAFWLLALPTDCKYVNCDIVRGYISQRFVQEMGGVIGFLSSTAYCSRKQTVSEGFVVKRDSASLLTEQLIEMIRQWNCSDGVSLFQCGRMLYDRLKSKEYISEEDVRVYDMWIADLKHLGYLEPSRDRSPFIDVGSYWNPPVMYSSPKSLISNFHLGQKDKTDPVISYIIEPMNKLCPGLHFSLRQWLSPPIQDIMLLVIFNYSFLFQNIPVIEYTHRRYFRHVLYCGPKLSAFEEIVKKHKVEHFIFVAGLDADKWFYLYTCMTHALTMNINVKGFLHVGDDILLNTWNILGLPRDHVWMQHPFTTVGRDQTKHKWWYYWKQPQGRTAVNRALDEIKHIAHTDRDDKIARKFITMYDANVGFQNVIHRSVDIFYMPSRFSKDFVYLAKIFRKHNVLLALAVTCIHAGLEPLDHVIHLRGKSLWKDKREAVWKHFNTTNHYLHPFKAGKDLRETAGQRFYCNQYLKTSQQRLTANRN